MVLGERAKTINSLKKERLLCIMHKSIFSQPILRNIHYQHGISINFFMIIRNATSDDITAISIIEKNIFESPWTDTMFDSELSREDSIILVATDEEYIVAYLVVRRGLEDAEIFRIAVIPAFRRTGIARTLLNRGEQWCVSHSLKKFLLEVDEINSSAIALYTSFGFIAVGRRKNYYDHRDAILMQKNLTSECLC
jgi:[ribosomal protein S18]-alanine N-acetyltransferase